MFTIRFENLVAAGGGVDCEGSAVKKTGGGTLGTTSDEHIARNEMEVVPAGTRMSCQ
jgi:hypothetical protein